MGPRPYPPSCPCQRRAAPSTSRRLRRATCGTRTNITTVTTPAPGAQRPLRCPPEAATSPCARPQAIHHQQRRLARPRDQAQATEPMLGKGARADPLHIRPSPRRTLGRDREPAAAPAANGDARRERPDDLRRLGPDQARRIHLLVRVVPIAPGVRQPPSEAGAGDLLAELCLEGLAGLSYPAVTAVSAARTSSARRMRRSPESAADSRIAPAEGFIASASSSS
jgi:hypothetical protein